MDSAFPEGRRLRPLSYHADIVAYCQRQEPEVWAWASSQKVRAEHIDEVRTHLLRDTYRLEADAHPEIHASLKLAMQRLGIALPVTLYQSGSPEMNAALVYVPGEIHLLLYGAMLERLSESERLALFGHELAHYLLWSMDDNAYLVADRILNDALAAPQAAASHRETARRYALHTELFADRGGAIAARALEPVVSTLVKVQTGISNPDAAAYLRQAAEIDSREAGVSGAQSHPETFLRARAVELWWHGREDLDAWIHSRLHGPLSLQRLDLPEQLRLQAWTRGFIAHFLSDDSVRSEAVLAQVRAMFPDWAAAEPLAGSAAFAKDEVADDVRAYLNALMMDLALLDPDTQDAALLRAGLLARELDSFEALKVNLKRDAGFGKRDLDRLNKRLAAAESRR